MTSSDEGAPGDAASDAASDAVGDAVGGDAAGGAAADAPTPAGPAIVIGHHDFAAGLVSAVGAITGRGDLLVPLSNQDAAVDEIERRIAEAADRHGARVVFTDLPAGSCAFAARRLLRERPDMIIVTGVSLAALVDYVFHAELPASAAATHAAENARKALAVVPGAAAAGEGGGGGRAG